LPVTHPTDLSSNALIIDGRAFSEEYTSPSVRIKISLLSEEAYSWKSRFNA